MKNIDQLIATNIMVAKERGWCTQDFFPPTSQSIAVIEDHFKIMIPQSLIQFLSQRETCSLLASFGENYDCQFHVIKINARCKRYRRRVIAGCGRWENPFPRNLVAINIGPDEDYICLIKDLYDEATNEYMIAYWSPPRAYELVYENFMDYMINSTLHWASQELRSQLEGMLGVKSS